ncbi:MAG: hypothetical protein HY747_07955 [Elusimicrobia bacterium]|nr:hypothetical protein [Elusimicrobiota bacterium]
MVSLFAIILGLNISLAQGQENADTAGLAYEENYFQVDENLLAIQEWAASFDPLGYRARRRSARGDFISRFETIVDTGCLPGSSSRRQTNQNIFEQDLGRVFSQIKACHEQYPELEGILKDVVTILRRSVFVCENNRRTFQELFQPTIGARTQPIHNAATPTRQGRTSGEHARGRHLYYISLRPSLEFLNSNAFPPERTLIYFHEPLHYTRVNNLIDHNTAALIEYSQKEPCKQNKFDDRITFLQTICGFTGGTGDAQDLLQRMNTCGLENACVKPLTYTNSDEFDDPQVDDIFGNGFAQGDADYLCQKIHDKMAAEAQDRAH